MGIAFVVVAGVVLISLVAVLGDIITKSRAPRNIDGSVVKELKEKIEALERQAEERDARLARLEGDVAFTTKLLEDKHDQQ